MNKENRKKYADNWEYISIDIRVNRAKNRCERCGVHNEALIHRHHDKTFTYASKEEEAKIIVLCEAHNFGYWKAVKSLNLVRIVLCVAHLDQDRMNNDYRNLRALCQHCHHRHDKFYKWITRKSVKSDNQIELKF